jgi:WD40 repeat protein
MTHYKIQDSPIRKLELHDDIVNGMARTRDGKKLATISHDGTLKLTVFEQPEKTTTLCVLEEVHWFKDVIFSVSEKYLVTCADDAKIRMHDIETGKCAFLPSDNPNLGTIFATLALSPDGTRLFACCHFVLVLDFVTGKQLCQVQDDDNIAYHVSAILPLTSTGSRVLFGTSGAKIFYMDITKPGGAILGRYNGHRGTVQSLALLGEGRQFISCAADHSVVLWDLESGAPLRKITDRKLKIWSAAVLPDRATVVLACQYKGIAMLNMRQDEKSLADYAVRMIMGADIVAETCIPIDARVVAPPDDAHGIYRLELNARGKLLATAGQCGAVFLWWIYQAD